MKKFRTWKNILCGAICILTVSALIKPQVVKAEEEQAYESGIEVPLDNNGGKDYENWWGDSELNVHVSNVPVSIKKGICEVTAFVPADKLNAGMYALEFFFQVNGNGYSGEEKNLLLFSIVGESMLVEDPFAVYQKIPGGYLVTLQSGFDVQKETEDYQILFKLHSENGKENGSIYFVDMKFINEDGTSTWVDFSDDALKAEGKKYSNEKKITVAKKKSNVIKLATVIEKMMTGDTHKIQIRGKQDDKNLTYTSSDETVAAVDKNGTITALAAGKTTITVTNPRNGASYSWSLSVLKKDVPTVFETGLAMTPYRNNNVAYENWWNESEICTYVENINIGIIRGGYGVSVFVPDYTLKDGLYGVEISLCKSRSPYDYFSYVGCEFTINNSVMDESSCTGVFRRTTGGYLVDMVNAYALSEVIGDYVLVLKVHSSEPGENGSLYFGDLFFADAISGFNYVDMTEKALVISAERLSTQEPLEVAVKEPTGTLTVIGLDALMYVGKQQKLKVQSEGKTVKLTYQTTDANIASVAEDGTIKANSTGEVMVSVKDSISGSECSVRLTVKEPYVAPQIEKNAVLVKNTYQYVGEGYGIDNPIFLWTSSNPEVATIDLQTGVFKALKEGKTTLTMMDMISRKMYSFEVEVYSVSNSELEKYITIETNGLLSAEMEQRVTRLLYEVYPAVFDYFADGKYDKVSCTFLKMDGVAYTTGNREMYINVDYLNANPADIDCITHELIHCAQAYPGGDVWLIEGITDYGRNIIGLYNKEANWKLATYSPGQNYTDSYQVTGGFLKYVVDNHNKNMITILNKALKKGFCPESIWEENTGYTIDELWKQYSEQ